jgi:hypothetical protein
MKVAQTDTDLLSLDVKAVVEPKPGKTKKAEDDAWDLLNN